MEEWEPSPFGDDFYDEQSYAFPADDTAPAHAPRSAPRNAPPTGRFDLPRKTKTLASDTYVLHSIRQVLAAAHGRPYEDVRATVSQIAMAEPVLERLSFADRDRMRALLEMLGGIANNMESGALDLNFVPTKGVYDAEVQHELATIRDMAFAGDVATEPTLAWFGLTEKVQRARALETAFQYADAIQADLPVETLVQAAARVEPPTTMKAAVQTRSARTAADVFTAHRAAHGTTAKLRISSGWRTGDLAFTMQDKHRRFTEQLGFIAPGEGFVVAGPTGTGKSSWTYGFLPAATQDLVNQRPDAKVLFAHTEEESIDKLAAMEFLPGQPFAHLAENLIIDDVGTDRQRVIRAIYDNVADAELRSKETGRPITDFLIHLFVLDYIQSLSQAGERDTTVSTAITAELLLRGIQAWNPAEMEKFSGLSYRAYTGRPWPTGMEHHRCAGIYMAQLVKTGKDKPLLYHKGERGCVLSDFALEASGPENAWKGPDGNFYMWEVKEGDLRLFTKADILGSSTVLNNAHAIIILHRSRPFTNPKIMGPDGRFHLEDTRARQILDKTRTGSALPYLPMSFDLDWEGRRARYIDVSGEHSLARGLFTVDECFQHTGHPLLPIRRAPSPLELVRY
jgi:hypothetical protein